MFVLEIESIDSAYAFFLTFFTLGYLAVKFISNITMPINNSNTNIEVSTNEQNPSTWPEHENRETNNRQRQCSKPN